MIRRDQILSAFSYVAVGGIAILLAVWVSSSFMKVARTQEGGPAEGAPHANEMYDAQESLPPPTDPALATDTPPTFDDAPAYPPADPAMGNADLNATLEKEQLRTEVQTFLEPFIYDPKGRRDPFRPYSDLVIEGAGPVGPVLPLQRFDLDQLRLIGIIWDVKDPKAMFLDPNSRIYTIGRDERIGPNNGYVAAIREGEVVVIETFRRRDGDPIYTPRVIRMER